MISYPSIETVFTRSKDTNRLNFGELRNSANSIISNWTISEKIDGTNIRVIITLKGVKVRGRTDKTDLKQDLIAYILSLFPHQKVVEYFQAYRGQALHEDWSVTFYGEGYGAGIQKGSVYAPDKRFRCFDLMLGEGWWVDDSEMRKVCHDLGVPTAPYLGMIDWIPETNEDLLLLIPNSIVAVEDRGVADVLAEGIVAKPLVVLKDRHGDRIVWKLTFREFK